MTNGYSHLEQERRNRGWSRAYVCARTGLPEPSLYNWEKRQARPRSENIEALCQLYGKSARDLGLVGENHDMMVVANTVNTHSQETIMSDLLRRAVFCNLGSKLTGLVDLWPKRNYHFAELQSEINKAILDFNAVVVQEPGHELTRRQAIKDMALVPVQLVGGITIIEAGKTLKTDTDLLLKHCAAGIAACWYLRRGKDLTFALDLTSSYIAILQPLVYSQSEAYRKASATLLSQNFRLKASITEHLKNPTVASSYYSEAIRYAGLAENVSEQAVANRMMAFSYWRQEGYEQALPHAETAYGLARSNKSMHRNIQSFCASGLSLCQAVNGHAEDAKLSLKEAHNFFEPTQPVSSLYYTESNLLAISASVKQHSGLWQESVNLYEKSLATPDISALGSIQARINYAKTEVGRDDIQTRNMGLCVRLLTEAITGAEELDSKHYIREARQCYDMLRLVWPHEDAVKTLGKDHFWK